MESHEEVLSTGIPPLPYFPALCRVLGGVTIAVVFVYLEIHHSAPEPDLDQNPAAEPARAGLRNPPISLDCDQACEDLGVSRRTLHLSLACLSVWWQSEAQRSSAARAGREFLSLTKSVPARTTNSIRPYSIIGSKQYEQHRIITIHRNTQRINQLAIAIGIPTRQPETARFAEQSQTSASSHSGHSPSEILVEVLGIKPIKRGIDWGWSDERKVAKKTQMVAYWTQFRAEKAKREMGEKS